MTCTRDDSTPCDCPSCEAAEDAFWREQEGDPDAPPEEYEFDVSDLADVTPLPAAPVVGVDFALDGAPVLSITKPRSRAKRRR